MTCGGCSGAVTRALTKILPGTYILKSFLLLREGRRTGQGERRVVRTTRLALACLSVFYSAAGDFQRGKLCTEYEPCNALLTFFFFVFVFVFVFVCAPKADQFIVDLPSQTVKILEGAQPLPTFELVTEKIGKTGKVVSCNAIFLLSLWAGGWVLRTGGEGRKGDGKRSWAEGKKEERERALRESIVGSM